MTHMDKRWWVGTIDLFVIWISYFRVLPPPETVASKPVLLTVDAPYSYFFVLWWNVLFHVSWATKA